ncbi:MAG: glycosyltransferase family 39 protein [Candidatus Kerfeldbacteria bacterium]|nr:glycosyltransferase family 39 protein [Candidatus Kerfeldbacteria bacterium]
MIFGVWPERLTVAGLIATAVVLYSSFSWGLPASRYNSPDEAANAYFAGRLAQGQTLAAPVPLNNKLPAPIIHPRSTVVVQGNLVPASFLGWPLLAGAWGRIFGAGWLPFLTPLGAILGLLCFYSIIRELFDRRTAVISTMLLVFLPAYWYYHARSLFHNALFFDLLLASAWFMLQSLRQQKSWYYLGAGLAVGLAVAVRTSEIFWILSSGLLWLVLSWRQVKPRYLPLLGLGALLGFAPVLWANYAVYGQVLSVGYRAGLKFPLSDLRATTSLLGELILPFGFHPRAILSNTYNYLLGLSWWWAVLATGGLAWLLARWRGLSSEQRAFTLKGFLACLWLVVLYGSWSFHDNPDPQAITLGTSYVRYWLPLYAFLLWPAGAFLSWLWGLKAGWLRAAVAGLVGVYTILSFTLVFYDPQEGLLKIRANIKRFEQVGRAVQQATEPESVIVSGNTEKNYWPERQEIVSLLNPSDYQTVRQLLEAGTPVYRFHPTWSPPDLRYMNERQLAQAGLKLAPVRLGFEDHSLYKFLPL